MRTKIIEKSTSMFLTLGFKSVTMDDIAEKMGISKKTIYTHFSNKEDLIEASSFFIFEQINKSITKIEEKKLNPIEETFKIKEVVSHFLKGEKTSPEFQLKKYYPKIYAMLDLKKREIINTCFKDSLERGVIEGCFRKDINIDMVSKFYYLCITGIKNNELFVSEDINNVMEEYLEYHIRAIATGQGLQTLNKILSK
ncbi:MAG: TetR/AcrR family transcriptional regulator [Flavobacteriales bacterium]|jgi:TetR/AcrR family transcriptional regulator, cholesterol catabolism regulator|nr:TetR/AcrR family transcriptional regulator [Flavobacteriales bacterium]